jgi:hypothetical protein
MSLTKPELKQKLKRKTDLPPCPRPIDMVVHYSYCPDAIATSDGGLLPCNNPAQWDETTQAAMMVGLAGDYDDPCATGGCLVSPDCSSGGCRVGELGGRWYVLFSFLFVVFSSFFHQGCCCPLFFWLSWGLRVGGRWIMGREGGSLEIVSEMKSVADNCR